MRSQGSSQYQERQAMEFRANYSRFVRWLIDSKCIVQEVMSKWEVLRYRASPSDGVKRRTHVVYRNADGRITFTGSSLTHWNWFITNQPMVKQPEETEPEKKARESWTARNRRLLIDRDGMDCFFCGKTMELDHLGRPTEDGKPDITIEHMLSQKVGRETGADVNHIDNLCLAHAKCNRDIGHQPVNEKLIYREILTEAKTDVEHWDTSHPEIVTVGRELINPPRRARP
jgi:hypothetical protein